MKKILLFISLISAIAQGQTTIQFAPPGWQLNGNSLGNNTSFLGSTDNRSLFFRNNNLQVGKWDTLGVLHIGAASITNTTSNGLLRINQGSIKTDLGTLSNFGAIYGALWFTRNTGTITPNTSNFMLLNDGATEAYLNAPTDSAILYVVGGNVGPPRITIFGNSTNDALPCYLFNSRSKTRVTAGANAPKFYIDLSSIQYKTGAIPLDYGVYVNGLTASAVGASTLTDMFTQWNDLPAPGTNLTMKNKWGFGTNGSANVTQSVVIGVAARTPLATIDDAGSLLVATTSTFTGGYSLLSTGAAANVGNATLVTGTKTIATTKAVTGCFIILTSKTNGGTVGNVSYTITNGVSFTINSTNPLDTSTYTWLIVNP